MNVRGKFFVVIILGLIAGCATNSYKSPNLNDSELAIVHFDSGISLFPTTINGKKRGFGFRSKFKLLPGKNEIKVIYNYAVFGGLYGTETLLVFNTEKGQEYSVRANLSDDKKSVDIGIYNKLSGKRISRENEKEEILYRKR